MFLTNDDRFQPFGAVCFSSVCVIDFALRGAVK